MHNYICLMNHELLKKVLRDYYSKYQSYLNNLHLNYAIFSTEVKVKLR